MLVDMIREVKQDKTVLRLQDEFFKKAGQPLTEK